MYSQHGFHFDCGEWRLKGGKTGVCLLNQFIYWFIFHSIFIPNWGMVGSLSVKSGFIIEFIFDNLPTLQIWGEKK